MKPMPMNCWPGGRKKCLTLSYDDGVKEDRDLIAIMNRHGVRGSFHLNCMQRGSANHIQAEEVGAVYAGHEVSVHMTTHPFPTRLTREGILMETLENRRDLERAAGYPVRGMSYPFGDYNSRVIGLLDACGIEYARTTKSHGGFHLPENWLEWHPTCHHNDCLTHLDRFLAQDDPWGKGLFLFYVWGHSYEFPRADNWHLIEEFCAKAGAREDIWYATNIEIVDYMHAARAVRSSVDGTMLYNPSALSVWFQARDGSAPHELKAGGMLVLDPT